MRNNFPQTKLCLDGFPKISMDGRAFPAEAYTSYLPKSDYYKQIAAQGLKLFCFPAYVAGRGINIHSGIGPFRKGIWNDENSFDFSDLEEDFDKILAAVDDPAVIIRLHLDVPTWWEEKYPEDCCIQNDGTPIRQSFSSIKWIEDSKRVLTKILRWLNDSPYGKYLAGIQVAAGGTEEWVYHYFDRFEDNCKDRITAYRKWMSENHEGDFSDALPADINSDVEFNNHTTETLKFHASQLADRICEFCETIKKQSDGHLITGAFYGYSNFIFEPRKGHNALGRLLECPNIDYLASPNAYDRQPGLDWPPMAAVDSIKLHGKLWMAEHDTRTSLTRPFKDVAPDICPDGQYEAGVWEGPADKRISQMLLRNNAARMLTHKYGGWWFDMWGGWFNDPILLSEIKLCQELAASEGGDSPRPDMCVVTDENLLFIDDSFGQLTQEIINQRQALAKAGTSYCCYLRSDLDKIPVKQFKFVWLLGCDSLTSQEQNIIDTLHMNQTGILHTDIKKSRFLASSSDTWQDVETFTQWTPELLRELYKQCDVHIYSDSNDIIYAGNSFLSIHAASAGKKQISLPGSCTITDAATQKTLCVNSRSFSINMPQYDTCLLKLT